MGGKAGTTTGLALLLTAGIVWAGGAQGGEGSRGLPPITPAMGREHAMGVCSAVEMSSDDWQKPLSVTPVSDAAMYFRAYNSKQIPSLPSFDSIRITRQPAHGRLAREKNAVGRDIYVYRPNLGYLGKDRFEAVIPVGNDTVRIIYNLVVQPDSTENEDFDHEKFCPRTEWKISLPTTPLAPSNLESLLTAAGIADSVEVTAADLPGATLALSDALLNHQRRRGGPAQQRMKLGVTEGNPFCGAGGTVRFRIRERTPT